MEASEFIRLAEPDRSTTLDRIGDMIGPGYEPCEDKNKTYADSPLYTDQEVISSNGAYIAEKGEIDSTSTIQNGLELNDEDSDKTIKLNKNVSKFA